MSAASTTVVMSPPRTLARDIGFTEGPIWTGTHVVATSITRGLLYRMTLDGGDAVAVAETGGGPNGLAHDPATGTVWIAQNGRVHMPARAGVPDRTPGLQTWPGTGPVRTRLEVPGSAPNDCVVGPDGRLWFTDPSGDPHEGEPREGSVCAFDPATGEVEVLWRTDGYPNGLAFGVDPGRLFLAETRHARVVELEHTGGRLRATGRAVTLPSGYPDGMAVAADGHLLVAGTTSGALEVVDPELRPAGTIDLGAGSMPTNVCFAGAGLDQVVVTLARGGRVVALESDLRGLPARGGLREGRSS
ncbi:SMP-30/gluconolactonase/LRE family protein [Actinomycetospora rhizophila]|uniref:SMP-30/gluconolactonase/LRE family protein n=1 Tax=Actinomycetospora rhizophila TaxID=1416876 RepID=A0ABV9ZD94_9PSEU